MRKIGVLISGGGTNLQSLIDGIESGNIKGEIKMIISNKKDAYGLERGRLAGIESRYLNPKDYEDNASYNRAILEEFKNRDIDLVVLAGYLSILTREFVNYYENKIINIHPSLIPSFCGDGYYGERVHRAVLDYGCKQTGATVHFVDEGTDTGPIIMQEAVAVSDEESVESLQKKVLEVEHRILEKAVKLICEDRVTIEDRIVKINRGEII